MSPLLLRSAELSSLSHLSVTLPRGSRRVGGGGGGRGSPTGSLASGGTGTNMFGAIFVNGLDRIVETLNIAYRGEQWRAGNSPDDGLTFQYSTDLTSIDTGFWTSVDALGFAPLVTDGNRALDGNVFSTNIFGSVSGLSISIGASVFGGKKGGAARSH